jgi:predicted metal-dependent peptidase
MEKVSCSDKELEEMLSNTKIHLMTKTGSMFMSSVSMLLEHRFSNEVPTAATNGKWVMYNPEFFFKLSKEERLGLLAHEVSHVCYLHMFRRGERDAQIWNMAADYVINCLLIKNNFKLPAEGLFDIKYDGMSTEQVYDLLVQNNTKPPPKYSGDLQEPTEGSESTIPEELEQEVTNIVIRAVCRTKMDHGNVPKEIDIAIEELINPKLDWKEILFKFVSEKSKDDYSWARPNRKYLPDFYLPSRYSEELSNIIIAIDTSGSMTPEFLTEILTEIQYINETLNINKLTIMDCDTKIHNIYTLDEYPNVLDLKFRGSGGTSVIAPIEYCKAQGTNLLIYFTDGCFNCPTEEPGFPVLWVISGDNKEVLPIGNTIFVD